MKKHSRPTLRWMICMTLDSVRPTQFSVTQTIHCNVGLKCFFPLYQNGLFVIIVMYAYFTNISQGSVETNLRCGEICNTHIIANCLQSVPVKKKFENRSIIGEDMNKSIPVVPRFFGPPCITCRTIHSNSRHCTISQETSQLNSLTSTFVRKFTTTQSLNIPESVLVKKFWKSDNNWQRCGLNHAAHFGETQFMYNDSY